VSQPPGNALRLRPTAAAVIALEVLALAAWALLPVHRFGWWPAALITAVAAAGLLISVGRRNAPMWVKDKVRQTLSRTTVQPAGAAVDVPCGPVMCGVRVEPHEAITMIEVHGRPYTPTFLRGASLSLTDNVLPMAVLVDCLDQPGGLRVGIDVVQSGQRVRPGTGYPQLYGTLLAERPAAGARRTWLVVRVDVTESVEGLAYRHSLGSAAAAATDRIVTALRQHGVRAAILSAAELDAALVELAAGLAAPPEPAAEDSAPGRGRRLRRGPGPAPVRPGATASEVSWRGVDTRPGHLTSYYLGPQDITAATLNQMWSLRSDAVVTVASLRRDRLPTRRHGTEPVVVSAVVRTDDPQRPAQPPLLSLQRLHGDQRAATLWAAPTARPGLALPTAVLDDPAALDLPVGPTGVLVGSALHDDLTAVPEVHVDDLVMLPLTDPERATRIVMHTSDFYTRQLVIRAAATGERVAIYSDDPARWESVSQPNVAVVHGGRGPEFVPTIMVNDRRAAPPAGGLAATVITLVDGDPGDAAPDLRFDQTSGSTVRITTPARVIDVAIVAFRQEQTWTG
jgi:type VII secretion protein EccE